MGKNTQGLRDELIDLLSTDSKHATYQMLPPCVELRDDRLTALVGTERRDRRRYDWLSSHVGALQGTAVDIGANLGYFSFRILQDFDVAVIAYEPHRSHARAICVIRDLCGIERNRLAVTSRAVGLREIATLPTSDLLIMLNVLHHAGEDFDRNLVTDLRQWRPYAIAYLSELRTRSRLLFFQMGYTWLGHAGKLCGDDEIIDFTASLLTEAKWRIRHCGVIHRYWPPFTYRDYPVSLGHHNPVALPDLKRSVLLRLKTRIIRRAGFDVMPYRFAQRPLWICEV